MLEKNRIRFTVKKYECIRNYDKKDGTSCGGGGGGGGGENELKL